MEKILIVREAGANLKMRMGEWLRETFGKISVSQAPYTLCYGRTVLFSKTTTNTKEEESNRKLRQYLRQNWEALDSQREN